MIKSYSNTNTKETNFTIEKKNNSDIKVLLVEKAKPVENKLKKNLRNGTKETSKSLSKRETNTKKVNISSKTSSEFHRNTPQKPKNKLNNICIDTNNNSKSLNKTFGKKETVIGTTNYSSKKSNFKNSLREEDEDVIITTEEVLLTNPNTTTNTIKKIKYYDRHLSFNSFKDRGLSPKLSHVNSDNKLIDKTTSNSKINLKSTKKDFNKIYKFTGKIIKEMEESKIRDENYNSPSKFKKVKKINLVDLNLNDTDNNVTKNVTNKPNSYKKSNNTRKNTLTHIVSRNELKVFKKVISNNVRPISEFKKRDDIKNTKNNINKNFNHTFNTNLNAGTANLRPRTSYRKTEIEIKINEASLSTEDSNVFRGRLEDYAIGKEIGKGAYAVVKQGHHKISNKKMAIKVYDKLKLFDPQKKSSVKKEIQILKKIDHKNIVKLNEVIESTNQILLIMELVNGVSLLAYLKSKPNRRIEEIECKYIFNQIVKGIAHCHSKNICHRDIKLENIIVDESKFIKIIDFGFGTLTTTNKLLNFFCGTPSYMPPEIVQKKDYLGPSADIWSLGILLYTLLCGAFPFRATSEKELYTKITKGVYSFPDNMSSSACDLVRRILSLSPVNRPTAEEILRDTWFNNENISYDDNFLFNNFKVLTPSNKIPKILFDVMD